MRQRLLPLSNSYFILSLIILLSNDFYLKYEYHNWITGKLSDVAGLFVFVYFWTAIFPRWKNTVYIFSGLMFVYWKSAYSQPLIDFFSENIYSIDRTIDMGDLLALLVLPIAYFINQREHFRLRMDSIPLAFLTIFSFCATSVPRPTQTFDPPEYLLFKSGDFEQADNFPNEFRVYDLDSMKVVAVNRIETKKRPALEDEFYKSQILTDLDLRVLCVLRGKYRNDTILNAYKKLRDSLAFSGTTSISLNLDSVSEELNFNGTRLDGIFRRHSKEKQLLIEGHYKHGIHDSVWSFYDRGKEITLRKHFAAGELTMIERFQNEKLVSTTDIKTRNEAITKQYILLIAIGLCLMLITIRLVINFRRSDKGSFVRMSTFAIVSQILLLPTAIFISAKVTSSLISDSHSDMFAAVGQFILANILLVPILAGIHYGLKLRNRFDLILYFLLFTLSLMWLQEFLYLKQILV